jgi:hypothetical protein
VKEEKHIQKYGKREMNGRHILGDLDVDGAMKLIVPKMSCLLDYSPV